MVMSNFRRSVEANTRKQGGGGRKGSYYERFKMPKNSPGGAPFILLPGSYTDPTPAPEQIELDALGQAKPVLNPYYKGRKHRRAYKANGYEKFSDEVCSAGTNPHSPQPCVGCSAIDRGDKTVSVADFFAMGMIHLAIYHGHPLTDRSTGAVVLKRETQEPVLIYDECEGRTCNYCKVRSGQQPMLKPGETWTINPSTISDIFGRRRYLEMGKGHLGDLAGFEQAVHSTCGTCRGLMVTDGFECPQCRSLVVDMQNDPRTDEQIAEAVSRPYPCLQCRKATLLEEILVCEACEARNQPGLPTSWTEVVLFGNRLGEGTKSHLTMARPFQTVEEFENQLHPNIRALLQGKTLRQHISEMNQPYDFPAMMAPRPLEDQAKRLELPMPGMAGMAASAVGQQYSQYGAQQPQQNYQQQQPFSQPQPQQQPAGPGPAPFAPPGRPFYGN